jgi:hypothetical protein
MPKPALRRSYAKYFIKDVTIPKDLGRIFRVGVAITLI